MVHDRWELSTCCSSAVMILMTMGIYGDDEEVDDDDDDGDEEEEDGVEDLVAPVRSAKVKKSLEGETNHCVH